MKHPVFEMGSEEQSVFVMIESIFHSLARPDMEVRHGSFDEIAIYLHGYTDAIREFGSGKMKTHCLIPFGWWLSKTQPSLEHITYNATWWVCIRALYPHDAEAFAATARLYREFLESLGYPHTAHLYQDFLGNRETLEELRRSRLPATVEHSGELPA